MHLLSCVYVVTSHKEIAIFLFLKSLLNTSTYSLKESYSLTIVDKLIWVECT